MEREKQYASSAEVADWRAKKADARMRLLAMPDREAAQSRASGISPSAIVVEHVPAYPARFVALSGSY